MDTTDMVIYEATFIVHRTYESTVRFPAPLKKSFGVAFTSSCKALQTARQAIGEAGIAMMRQPA